MLTKYQAESIGNEIVRQQRVEADEARDRRALPLSLIHRSKAVRSLRPWQQALIVKRAKRERWRHLPSIFLTVALAGLVFGLLLWFGDKPIPASILWPVLAISFGLTHLAVRWEVRRAAARLAEQDQRREGDPPLAR